LSQSLGEGDQRKTGRQLKRHLLDLLSKAPLEQTLRALQQLPPRRVINPLFSFLLSTDPRVRWTAVTGFGAVVSRLADQDMESARVVMRRLTWQLNDESGGIGWGCPEAMGEIVACHRGLAEEYAGVLVSYVDEGGNFLEYEPLRRGALWGIARAAQARPSSVRRAKPHLTLFLDSPDNASRGLATWALGLLKAGEARSKIERLTSDNSELLLYRNRKLEACRLADLAREALLNIGLEKRK
jgi:hypothetical protein